MVIKKKEPRSSEDSNTIIKFDVQYSPDVVAGLLLDLQMKLESKCYQLQKDSDFMATSIKQAFHLELIKLPSQVKNMSLKRFQEEFGDSLESVTRGAIGGSLSSRLVLGMSNVFGTAKKSNQSQPKPFQTPSGGAHSHTLQIQAIPMRNPREGEKIVSMNGSPLGDFKTVIKAPKQVGSIIPATPGVFIPLASGDVVDLENLDLDRISLDQKEDALMKMQEMMNSIQMCMSKLEKS
jgi:Nbl1 / Borealin N terminal/Cell division cycle-associated protein 8